MLQKFNLKTFELHLCSRCLNQEVGGWINERWKELDEEVRKQILQELRAIDLKEGNCIVCGNNFVSNKTLHKILKILEDNNVPENIKKEFKRDFCIL